MESESDKGFNVAKMDNNVENDVGPSTVGDILKGEAYDFVIEEQSDSKHQDKAINHSLEVSRYSKRKRIHMDAVACNELLASDSGSRSLSCPQSQPSNKDVHRGLHPVVRYKKRKIDDENNSEFKVNDNVNSSFPVSLKSSDSSSGFVSASQVYKTCSQPSPWKNSDANDGISQKSKPLKANKAMKQIRNQTSILNFVTKSSPSISASVQLPTGQKNSPSTKVDQNDAEAKDFQFSSHCVMYSPIKKMNNDSKSAIYISDSPTDSLSSSQSSTQSGRSSSQAANNAVVKKLFEAAKNFDPKSKVKKGRKDIVKMQDIKTIRNEAAKYFENDSFDMSSAFDSDMDDSCEIIEPKSDGVCRIKKVSDKYGLLGSGTYPKEEKVNYFERLPYEVLENIFCQLPMLDLCLNSNRVCRQWNSIIADAKVVNNIYFCKHKHN